jgi:hypothetical protein
MVARFDITALADDLQMVGKFIRDPAEVVAKQQTHGAIRSLTKALERVGAEIYQQGMTSGAADISLMLYAARELERYVCGEKTQICDRRMAAVYYQVLCAGIEQLPR